MSADLCETFQLPPARQRQPTLHWKRERKTSQWCRLGQLRAASVLAIHSRNLQECPASYSLLSVTSKPPPHGVLPVVTDCDNLAAICTTPFKPRPRRDVSTSRDGLETETSRPRPHQCNLVTYTTPPKLSCFHVDCKLTCPVTCEMNGSVAKPHNLWTLQDLHCFWL